MFKYKILILFIILMNLHECIAPRMESEGTEQAIEATQD